MKIDGTKIAAAIESEIEEIKHYQHDGVVFAIGKIEVRKSVFAQVQIKITIDTSEKLKDPEWSLNCISEDKS